VYSHTYHTPGDVCTLYCLIHTILVFAHINVVVVVVVHSQLLLGLNVRTGPAEDSFSSNIITNSQELYNAPNRENFCLISLS